MTTKDKRRRRDSHVKTKPPAREPSPELHRKRWGWPARMEVIIEELIASEVFEQPALFEHQDVMPWDSVAKGE